jgi:hypothetical protein
MGKKAKQAANWVGNQVNNVAKSVGNTIVAVIKNPLPTLETLALTYVGVPPTAASAIVTAMNGGTPEQVFKAAAFSSIPAASESISQVTGLGPVASTALASAGVSVITGSSVEQALTNAAISVAVSGSKPYVAAEINNLISSPTVANALTNATLTAEAGVLQGRSADQISQMVASSFGSSAMRATAEMLAPSSIMPTTNPDVFNAAKDSLAASNAFNAEPLAPAETLGATPLDSANQLPPEVFMPPMDVATTSPAPQTSAPVESSPLNALPVEVPVSPTSPIDATTQTKEPHPTTLPLTLPEEITQPLDTVVDANYALNSTLTPKLGVDSTTGTGFTAKPETMGAGDVGYTPVDYALTNPSGLPDGTGLQMPTSSNIKSMGGGQGLTADVTNPVTGETGTVGELGYTPTGAIPVTDPAYNTTTAPKATTSGSSNNNFSSYLAGLPIAAFAGSTGSTGTSTSSPIDAAKVAESYLTTRTVNGQELTLPQLKQLYPEVVPELSKLLIERGMILNPSQQEVKFGDYPQTAPTNSSSGELNPVSLANFGQPTEDYQYAAKGGSMRLPKGHKPEFITGQTGHYAQGRGTGQSDDIPAVLHDGDYVVDADTVAAFGDGSSKAGAGALEQFRRSIPEHHSGGGQPIPAQIADGEYVLPAGFVTTLGRGSNKQGAKMLDAMREQIRAHKRSAPDTKIPPKAKSPLQYMLEAQKSGKDAR